MINEARIKLMTRMASYEAGEGKKNMAIGTYFRGDYIGKEVIKSVIYGTITFLVLVALYVCYDFEVLLKDIYQMDLLAFGKDLLLRYLELVVGYAAITYLVYALRYQKARRSLKVYYNNLSRLGSMYRKEQMRNKKNKDATHSNYEDVDGEIYDAYLGQRSPKEARKGSKK